MLLQVIRVKWSLHAREEIIIELLRHLRGNATRAILERERKSAREMLEEQEAVRGRLFTIQDVMQSTVRAWLQVPAILQKVQLMHSCVLQGGGSKLIQCHKFPFIGQKPSYYPQFGYFWRRRHSSIHNHWPFWN